jgi:Protein of unknown function (DUF3606)
MEVPMADDLRTRGALDRSHISMNQVSYWTITLGCSQDELAAAITRVGIRQMPYGASLRERGDTGHFDQAPFDLAEPWLEGQPGLRKD